MSLHQWSLAKKVAKKLKSDAKIVPNQAKTKGDGVKKIHKITISVNTENFDALITLRLI